MKRICWYLQGNKYKSLVFNPSKKVVLDCYAGVIFAGLRRHGNPRDPIFDRNRTELVVSFYNCSLLWLLKLHAYIDLSTLHSEYVTLSHSDI